MLEFDKFYFTAHFLLNSIREAKKKRGKINSNSNCLNIYFFEMVLTLCTVFAPSINSNKQDHDRVQDLFATLNFLILNRFRRLN